MASGTGDMEMVEIFGPRASMKIIKERFPKHEDGLELAYWCVLRREWMGCWGLLG